MQVKSLEISGFKSFAKKIDLEFRSPIVSIVGPNGSGKSNVAEAFRFVLGEQSMKSMRGKRGEDLIWDGSKTMPKMNRAYVRLVFANENKLFNIDFDEVIIERAVHRDGVNEYFINGTQVRLRDVLELLSQANIGSSGHHIISQGEADRILTASIKERRAMIEDALGLKVYQYKREESLKKLEKTEENIKQVQSLRKEIAPHIKFLEKQVEKINKAENLRQDLYSAYQEYLAREEIYLAYGRDLLKKEREVPETELHLLEKKIKEAREFVEETESNSKVAEEILSLEKDMHEAEEKVSAEQSSLSRIEGEISAQERMLRHSELHGKNIYEKQIPFNEIENLHGEIKNLAISSIGNESSFFLRSVIEKIANVIDKFVSRHHENMATNNNFKAIEEEIRHLENERHQRAISLDKARNYLHEIREDYNKIRELREEKNTRGREAERELFSLMNRRSELSGIIFSLRNREELIMRDEESYKIELKEAEALVGHTVLRFDTSIYQVEGERAVQEDRKKKIERMKIRLEEAGAAGGEEIKKEYQDTLERDQFLAKEITDLENSSETLRGLIKDLEEKLEVEFKDGISKINQAFQGFFELMFGGGRASLSAIKEEKRGSGVSFNDESESQEEISKELEEGLEVNVSLPHKRIKGLSMLSGGERALTSIALLFAISQVNPPPFIILDETDAALDEANSKKYGDMIENLSKHSQLIVITHNRETMSRAGILYGVTMGSDGFSKILSVKFDDAVAVAK